ncbi:MULTISPECIES: hypothetical protein [Cyanophyceae]|uniref:hypothetical protein n=1 Tax=Cyanophyceae TaxID=3028117 RepID=UPI001686DE7B|nr:hypothetical protein [Trichocoleus sp. FACHB-69]MBD1932768.1 hypothetical protein [Trichocoleus sp. FACHB-69]
MNEPKPIIETTQGILTRAASILSKHSESPEINNAKKSISAALSSLNTHLKAKGDEIFYDDVNWDDYEK